MILRLKKSLGQNFCRDPRLIVELVESLSPSRGEVVWEIGPGEGALTAALMETGARVHAFEIDERLKPHLEARFAGGTAAAASSGSGAGVVKFHWGDFLELSLEPVFPVGTLKICGNLPYYCGTAIIQRLLELGPRVSRMVFTVQEEVARKAAAIPRDRDYGFLSVRVRWFAETSLGSTFGPSSFFPRPKVSSTLLKLEPLSLSEEEVRRRTRALALPSRGFSQRRKMLLPLLRRSFTHPSEEWDAVFSRAGISPKARIEELSPECILALAGNLRDCPEFSGGGFLGPDAGEIG